MVVDPRLNGNEWDSPLVNSQHKLDFLVGAGAQNWRKINTSNDFEKKNLFESYSKNETT